MSNKKFGSMGKLSQLSGIKPPTNDPPTSKKSPRPSPSEKLATLNIKVSKSQKDWLGETASQVRDNNTEPVPPSERVYPQHLIGVAIELLQSAQVDWSQVKNIEELREQLNL
jgi:hypothetical protein